MIEMTLAEVAEVTGGHLEVGHDRSVTAVSTDSRAVGPASLFVALRSPTGDGHAFVEQACAAGAVASLVERVAAPGRTTIVVPDTWQALQDLAREVRRRVHPLSVAVTGSVGKTTVKDFTAAAVAAGRNVHAARGSFNNELGVPLTLLGLRAEHDVLVAEIGARHTGDIAALAPLVAPDVAIVTAVAAVHLEVFGSVERIALAKRELVEALEPGGLAVLNAGDRLVASMASVAPRHLYVALEEVPGDTGADVWAEGLTLDERARPSATAVTPWGRVPLRLPLAGRHQVLNGLFALAVAGHLGVDLDAAAKAIADAPVSPWRGAVEDLGGIVLLDDAYNANPTAVVAALGTLAAIRHSGATVAVLGEMAEIGPTSEAEHRAIGRRCHELGIDRLVAVGVGASPVADGATEAGMRRVDRVADANEAVALLRERLAPGDAVLVKASRVAGLERIAKGLRSVLGETDAEARP